MSKFLNQKYHSKKNNLHCIFSINKLNFKKPLSFIIKTASDKLTTVNVNSNFSFKKKNI